MFRFGSRAPKAEEQEFAYGVFASAPVALIGDGELEARSRAFSESFGWSAKGERCAYLLRVALLGDASSAAEIFGDSILGLLDAEGSEILVEEDVLLQGWPGIKASVSRPGGLMASTRIYVTDRLFVQATCIFPRSSAKSVDRDPFLDSVRLPIDGPLKSPGATLSRYPIGDTKVTVLLPSKPEFSEGNGFPRYVADYALRSFQVSVERLPEGILALGKRPLDVDAKLRHLAASAILDGHKARHRYERETKVGTDIASITKFTMGDGMRGTLLVLIHGDHEVALIEHSIRAYIAHETVEAFLHSVEFE